MEEEGLNFIQEALRVEKEALHIFLSREVI